MWLSNLGLLYLNIVSLLLYLSTLIQNWVSDLWLPLNIGFAIEFVLDVDCMEALLQRWSVETMCK